MLCCGHHRKYFSDRLRKFLDFSESERAKKMVTHEKYLHHRLNDENEDLSKSHNKKELKESQLLLNELLIRGKDFSRINLVQLNDLQSFAAQMLKKLEFKDDEFNEQRTMYAYSSSSTSTVQCFLLT
ncbi:hypothetical protein Salat_1998000 [Sesamum alatum]|uniref:Uncharacterized protein n=1 Tax=Sesamum alatum TaxID=300844 RepID=A0AAE1XYJ3_9LAMI|nr:hypothetical protein Salat_1998000 [Sesamum alatum]